MLGGHRAGWPICLDGEVIEILERPDERLAKLRVEPHSVVEISIEVTATGLNDLHLGDRLWVDGEISVGRVRRAEAVQIQEEK
jgi:hypothetical protein